ncbi:hypothetical protein CRV08_04120 [Halarcobacter ebronensis]|uniref:ABC transporter domain-containing protein n=1 Tax=Halarcobacter ebronensis TaxID=1462615 RepID=A0A4Q0YFB1_9BACT|nr:ABC transporter ATP-binding protein [Halarcobacter ebronensis]RXJ69202.1 hypothetical protein CRV08_04120 [Halarcobacter ebronensis]
MSTILEVKNLTIKDRNKNITIVENINFTLNNKEILGVVGKSGSGKSLLCKALLQILPATFKKEGVIKFNNSDENFILGRDVSVIWQDALNAFDPLCTIKEHMCESFLYKIDKNEAQKRSLSLLKRVGITDCKRTFFSYPNELSGGELQRVMIAIALLQETKLIIADEPTSSLDLITQKQIIDLIKELNKTLIFVTHDLALISKIAHKILILNNGKVEEYGVSNEVFATPKTSYTKDLLLKRERLSKRFLECLK